MPEQPNLETTHNNQSTMVEGELAGTINEFPQSTISDSQTLQNTQALIEENHQLRDEIKQLKKINKKAVRIFNQVQELKPYQAELIQLQQCLERRGQKMIVIFEGRGGSGKGGTIRRITRYMNAKHYRVVALAKPTAEERSQWFYQKYVREFPRAGDMVLFHRSWYTRCLIEPAFGFCTDREYQDFMEGVGGFEMDLVNQDIILIKLYFSVSREERARRFEQRRHDPLQSWKLNEIDLEVEEHRDEVTEAKYEMLRHTHTLHAPWTVIRSDSKHLARLNAMKVILNAVNYERLDPQLDLAPDPKVAFSGAFELERMEALRLQQGKLLGSHAAYLGGGGKLNATREGKI